MNRGTLTQLLLMGLGLTLGAQSQADRFDVASVKRNISGDIRYSVRTQPGGRFTATNVTVRTLILYAYGLQGFQLEDVPRWATSDRFDIVARAAFEGTMEQVRLMVRTLLVERFQLKAHPEIREQPLYALTKAREDGQLGPQLRRSEADCALQATPEPGIFDPTARCRFLGPAPGVPLSQGRLAFRGMTIDAFARSLVPLVGRGVVDRTGLTGFFDADFDATTELAPPPPPPGIPDPFDRQSFPSIFTVLRQQLGLKLEAARGSVDVLVIDAVEQPIEN